MKTKVVYILEIEKLRNGEYWIKLFYWNKIMKIMCSIEIWTYFKKDMNIEWKYIRRKKAINDNKNINLNSVKLDKNKTYQR